ncbi:MAG: UDP-glucose 4-epimerase GalE, partial [Dehalococcoidia bacterium]
TGGAGYIGSTICSALEDNGHIPVVIDSFVTGNPDFVSDKVFYKGDIGNHDLVEKLLKDHPEIEAVIHCAARIVVPESTTQPYLYYKENVSKSLDLFYQLQGHGLKRIVFSSTAALYKSGDGSVVTEDSYIEPNSPYARTKFATEMALRDFCAAYDMKAITLRYFNPIGADPRMRSGPHVKNPSHILGKLISVLEGEESTFNVAGTNWPTRDGTGIRDYIHVWDLAKAHVLAVEKFDFLLTKEDFLEINLGTGKGTTVLEFIEAFEEVSGAKINWVKDDPRPGDVTGVFASGEKARKALDWIPRMSLEQGIADSLKWFRKNRI